MKLIIRLQMTACCDDYQCMLFNIIEMELLILLNYEGTNICLLLLVVLIVWFAVNIFLISAKYAEINLIFCGD